MTIDELMAKASKRPWQIVAEPYEHLRDADRNCAWANDYRRDGNIELAARAVNVFEQARAALKFVQSDPCYRNLGSVTHDEVAAALAAMEKDI